MPGCKSSFCRYKFFGVSLSSVAVPVLCLGVDLPFVIKYVVLVCIYVFRCCATSCIQGCYFYVYIRTDLSLVDPSCIVVQVISLPVNPLSVVVPCSVDLTIIVGHVAFGHWTLLLQNFFLLCETSYLYG